jgi:transcription antitermination factor NusG
VVARTKQATSRDAITNAERQGFEIFHGRYLTRPIGGKRRERPIFPYYLLVRYCPDNWKVLFNTRGVSHLLMNGDKPHLVEDHHVETFRGVDGYYIDAEQEAPRFKLGEGVRSMNGLFRDCEGIYQGLAGPSESRVRVLFRILGVPKVMELSAYDLVAA